MTRSKLHLPCRALATLLTAGIACSSAWAQDQSGDEDNSDNRKADWSAEIGVGAEYDSNVSVDEIDTNSNESDTAMVLDAELGVSKPLSDNIEFSLSYDLSQSWYEEFDNLNRQTHIIGADLGVEVGKVDSGLSYYYINSRLDGDSFLESQRVSPYVSRFLSKKWYTRGAYVFSDKTLEERSERDAEFHAGEFDLYYFQRGLRSYFNFGIRYKDEDAESDEFDYQSGLIKLRYVRRFQLFSRLSRWELAWRYEDRDYSDPTPEIGEQRRDKRHRFKTDLEIPLFNNAEISLYYKYGDYQSNLERADYLQHVIGTRLQYSWD